MKNAIIFGLLATTTSLSWSALAKEADLVAVKAQTIVTTEQPDSGFQDIIVTNATLISFGAKLPQKNVEAFVATGFDAVASPKPKSKIKLQTCSDAVVVFKAGKGNVLPNDDGSKTQVLPEVVAFSCINK